MRNRRLMGVAAVALSAGLALAGCSSAPSAKPSASSTPEGKKLNIVATTGYLADAVKNIAPTAQITTLVKPGGDPHTQELTAENTAAMEKADLVVWTSHDMEHKMMDTFDKMGEKQLPAAEGDDIKPLLLDWIEDGKVEGHDPHVWNSPDIWMLVVNHISDKLGKIDAKNADTYKKNAEAYNMKIKEAKDKAAAEFKKIPKENRLLVTGHDAFNYLGKTFDLDIEATDFVSSESEISATQLDELAQKIADRKIPKIFQDNLKNPKAIENLKKAVESKGGKVEVSDEELFADTLGESAPVDTYLGAFQHNAEVITKALSQK